MLHHLFAILMSLHPSPRAIEPPGCWLLNPQPPPLSKGTSPAIFSCLTRHVSHLASLSACVLQKDDQQRREKVDLRRSGIVLGAPGRSTRERPPRERGAAPPRGEPLIFP